MNKISKAIKYGVSCVVLAVLAACGGGGGGDGDSSASESAAGFWVGDAVLGEDILLTVTQEGKVWGWQQNASGQATRLLRYDSQVSGSTVSATGVEVRMSSGIVTRQSVSGSVQTKSALRANVGGLAQIDFGYDSDFDAQLSLANLVGSYDVGGITPGNQRTGGTATVNGNGAMAVQGFGECTATGSVTPSSNGRGYFNLSLRFAGARCELGDGVSITGILIPTAANIFVALGLTAADDNGFFIGAQRSVN